MTWFAQQIGPIFLVLTFLAGCDRPSTSNSAKPPSTKIDVFATVYPLAEMAQRVGGEAVRVQWLVESGQRPEDLDPTTDMKQRASRAALVVTSGPWDAWAATLLSTEARANRLIEPERMPAARGAAPTEYLWLDPAVAKELLEEIRIKLTVIDPSRDAEFRKNAEAYAAELDAVEQQWNAAPLKGERRSVLVVRPVWGALARRHGLTAVAPVPVSEEKLTAADFKTLARHARENGVNTIFVDVATPAAVRLQIQEKTGLKALTLDPLGTSASDGRNSLPKVLRYDLEQLKSGLDR